MLWRFILFVISVDVAVKGRSTVGCYGGMVDSDQRDWKVIEYVEGGRVAQTEVILMFIYAGSDDEENTQKEDVK